MFDPCKYTDVFTETAKQTVSLRTASLQNGFI